MGREKFAVARVLGVTGRRVLWAWIIRDELAADESVCGRGYAPLIHGCEVGGHDESVYFAVELFAHDSVASGGEGGGSQQGLYAELQGCLLKPG